MCDCVVCRHNRGEVSDDYYKGWLESEVRLRESIIKNFAGMGYKVGSLSDRSKPINHYLAGIECDLDSVKELLQELKDGRCKNV